MRQAELATTQGEACVQGGGEETRSNKWLAELQQTKFIEINPADAADRGIKESIIRAKTS